MRAATSGRQAVALGAAASSERGTRARVARLILELGPPTASVIGNRLGLTPAAIRRHLDTLLAEGLIETRTARTYASRGRGRPARLFAITDAGRSAFEHAYDDLASSALRFLAEAAGPAAGGGVAHRPAASRGGAGGPGGVGGVPPPPGGRAGAAVRPGGGRGRAGGAGPGPG